VSVGDCFVASDRCDFDAQPRVEPTPVVPKVPKVAADATEKSRTGEAAQHAWRPGVDV